MSVFLPLQGCHCHQRAGGSYVILEGCGDLAELLLCSPPEISVGCPDMLFSSRFKVAATFEADALVVAVCTWGDKSRSREQKILRNRSGDSIPVQN